MLWIAAVAGLAGLLTLIPLTTHSDENKGVVFLPSPIDVLTNDSSKEQIKEAINFVVNKNGWNERDIFELQETVFGESGYDPNADNGISAGLSQFTLSTWIENCSNKDDRKDPKKSIKCMVRLWEKGEQHRWDVWCMRFGRDNYRCQMRGF